MIVEPAAENVVPVAFRAVNVVLKRKNDEDSVVLSQNSPSNIAKTFLHNTLRADSMVNFKFPYQRKALGHSYLHFERS